MMDFLDEESIIKVSKITEISWDETSAGIRTPHEFFL